MNAAERLRYPPRFQHLDPADVQNQYRCEDGTQTFVSVAELHYLERQTLALERLAAAFTDRDPLPADALIRRIAAAVEGMEEELRESRGTELET